MVRKVPGNLRSQEFVFFLVRFFCPLEGPGDPPKKTPTQIKTQFAQTISGHSVQIVPLFPLKRAENRQKEFAQTVCAHCFYFGFLGWGAPESSFRAFSLHPLQKSKNQRIKKYKNGASGMISVTQHKSGTNHRNGK